MSRGCEYTHAPSPPGPWPLAAISRVTTGLPWEPSGAHISVQEARKELDDGMMLGALLARSPIGVAHQVGWRHNALPSPANCVTICVGCSDLAHAVISHQLCVCRGEGMHGVISSAPGPPPPHPQGPQLPTGARHYGGEE